MAMYTQGDLQAHALKQEQQIASARAKSAWVESMRKGIRLDSVTVGEFKFVFNSHGDPHLVVK